MSTNAEYAKQVKDSIPEGFYGEPEDLSRIVSLLWSEQGRSLV